ncbi:MAG: hypothetical protein ACXWMW_03860, partial [Syntrophales bacterium]
ISLSEEALNEIAFSSPISNQEISTIFENFCVNELRRLLIESGSKNDEHVEGTSFCTSRNGIRAFPKEVC